MQYKLSIMSTWSILISLSIKNMPEIIPDVGPWNKLNSQKRFALWFLLSVFWFVICLSSTSSCHICDVLGRPL